MRWGKAAGIAALVIGGLIVWSSTYVWLGCNAQPVAQEFAYTRPERPPMMLAAAAAMPDYARPAGSGMLGYVGDLPELAKEDLARFLNQEQGDFPYFGTVQSFWQSYCSVSKNLPGGFLANWQAHVRTYVEGVLHSAEFGLWGLYHMVTGRRVGPAGLFRFAAAGAGGLPKAPASSPDRFHAIVVGLPKDHPYARVLESDAGVSLVALPLGRGAQTALREMAQTPARLLDMAGNDTVLLTALVPSDWDGTRPAPNLFANEVAGGRLFRMGLLVPVGQLLATIRGIEKGGGAIQAIYP